MKQIIIILFITNLIAAAVMALLYVSNDAVGAMALTDLLFYMGLIPWVVSVALMLRSHKRPTFDVYLTKKTDDPIYKEQRSKTNWTLYMLLAGALPVTTSVVMIYINA